LGSVAQEQRQWAQAEQYYQQALRIFVEYNDRYSQASIYGQLGLLAQEQGQWMQACDYLLQALEIFVAYEDNYTASGTLRNLARLWRESGDTGVSGRVAEKLGVSGGEAEELLREMLGEGDGGKDEE
jgi:tetratricopeptide (TPR) repeat protein